MIIAVFDANIFVSALISSKGASARLVALSEQNALTLAMSAPILAEIRRVLHYPRILKKYQLADSEIIEFLDLLQDQVMWVEAVESVRVVADDPDDDKYLECAVAAGAQFIISGDRHLLDLEHYEGIEILAPAAFMAYMRAAD